MAIPSIYINLEDDVSKIVARINREKSSKLVLVCPKRCFLFTDSINLRLLKKHTDLLKKEVFVLTMDERGQMYAKDAGFVLKFLSPIKRASSVSDIRSTPVMPEKNVLSEEVKNSSSFNQAAETIINPIKQTVTQVKNLVSGISPKITAPKIETKDTFRFNKTEKQEVEKKNRSATQKFIAGFVVLSMLSILFVVFVILPKATVVVHPKSEPITRDMDITIGTPIKKSDAEKLILPGYKISQTLEITKKFQSLGKKEVGNKSVGMVRIYNFTRAPLNLKANTTTLIVGNKSYALQQDITGIRPTIYKNNQTKEVDENSLDGPFEILALQAGEGSDLPSGTRMEINNQVFGSKPLFLFGKTDTAITGGTTRYLSLVSAQDIASAQNSLAQQLISNLQNSLKSKKLVLIEKSYVIEPLAFSTDKPAGTESPNFEGSLKAKITGIAFNDEELVDLITERITSNLATNKSLEIKNNEQLSYKLKTIDLNNETAIISAHFEGKVLYKIDLTDISKELIGKTQSEVNEILRSRADIEQVDIQLAPSWQKTFPRFSGKIHVSVEK